MSVTLYDRLLAGGSWRPLRYCPGRRVWAGPPGRAPADMVGRDHAVQVFRVPAAADPVHVVVFEGGGLISYQKPDGQFVHTLNTPDGLARKLAQLGIAIGQASTLPPV